MVRTFNLVSQAFTSLAFVCAVLAVLAVPSNARGDPITDCQNLCMSNCFGSCTDPSSTDCKVCVEACDANCVAQNTGPQQCPNKLDPQGNFLGCLNPGAQCTLPTKKSTCTVTMSGKGCTCAP